MGVYRFSSFEQELLIDPLFLVALPIQLRRVFCFLSSSIHPTNYLMSRDPFSSGMVF